jgi:pyrophosphatase PpaX
MPPSPPLQTFLFDLDGTLIDSVRLILDSYHHALRAHGIPARSDDEWLAGIGTPLRVQFAPWKDDQALLEALIVSYREFNLSNHDRMVTVYPGVVDMVDALKAAGHGVGLVTSKNRHGAALGLRLAGIHDHMDVLIGADDVENPKPHPEPVEKAMALLGAEPATTIYIGDSIHDMRAGRAAGVRTGAALWGPFGREHLEGAAPDHWLERPAQILELPRAPLVEGARPRHE